MPGPHGPIQRRLAGAVLNPGPHESCARNQETASACPVPTAKSNADWPFLSRAPSSPTSRRTTSKCPSAAKICKCLQPQCPSSVCAGRPQRLRHRCFAAFASPPLLRLAASPRPASTPRDRHGVAASPKVGVSTGIRTHWLEFPDVLPQSFRPWPPRPSPNSSPECGVVLLLPRAWDRCRTPSRPEVSRLRPPALFTSML